MAVLTINHYVNQVNTFINQVANTKNAYYVFTGRPYAWPNDSTPPAANGSLNQIQQSVYDDMLFGKLLTSSDLSPLIPRYNWTSNTVYAVYDQNDPDLYSKQFYVVTDQYQVYKCIYNNFGDASTVKPTLTSSYGTFSTGDGYIWKYMYTIDAAANTKFTSSAYIPVATDTNVQGNAVPGSIDAIAITNGGSNYQVYESGFIYKLIDPYTIQLSSTSSSIDNYYANSSIYLKAGWGAGQIRQIQSSNGSSKQIRVNTNAPFNSYTRLDFTTAPTGTVSLGYTAQQTYDYVQYGLAANNGYFNPGITVIQSDTGAVGTVWTANSSTLVVARTTNTTFSLTYPIRDASQDGTSKPGTVNITASNNWIVSNTGTQFTDAANGYSIGDYIRVGSISNNNIRRVTSVNTTVIVVDTNMANTLTGLNHYKLPVAAEISSVTVTGANGTVSNTNLTSKRLTISSPSIPGIYFTVGEKVDLVNSSNTNQGANATVAFSNSSTVYLSAVAGSWVNGYYILGESSNQRNYINSIDSNPNITISNPSGTFLLGQSVNFYLNGSNTGAATLSGVTTLPNDQTEYQIGPTVNISGDGVNAIAIGVVNTTIGSSNAVIGATVINPGTGYTFANVSIYANGQYGSGATASAVISPINGHGYDAVTELGGIYLGIDKTFDTGVNESFFFPTYGTYRRAGIIQNPQFADIRATLTNFDRVSLSINNKVTSTGNSITNWVANEVVVQPSTNAAGVVVGGNSTFLQLKNVLGTFTASNAQIKSYYSNTTANVATTSVNYFQVTNNSNVEFVTQMSSGATGEITALISNTQVMISNVVGQFVTGDTLVDSTVNAYAIVGAISTANGSRDVTNTFGLKFNQTLRLTLTSNTGAFSNGEYAQQTTTGANGRIFTTTNELDLTFTANTGAFNAGQVLTDVTTNANGIITYANSTYIKLTSVSQGLNFVPGHTINNGLSSNATVSATYPVLMLHDVNGANKFQAGAYNVYYNIVGQTSGAVGQCNSYSLITYPELVRESGKVIYIENFAPVTRTQSNKEEIKIVLQF
jgi:hypothetical protein